MERLVPVPASAAIAGNSLAKALTFGTPPQAHFPAGVASLEEIRASIGRDQST